MRFLKKDFVKQVLTLVTGTGLAQLLPLLLSPILTRLYSPEDFGTFATFSALVMVFSTVATGKLELATLLPKEKEEAAKITALSLRIALGVSSCLAVLIVLYSIVFQNYTKNSLGLWLYLVPVSVFFSAIYEVLKNYAIREKQFKHIAISTVMKSGVMSALQVVLGGIKAFQGGLIVSNVVSLLGSNTKLYNVYKKNRPQAFLYKPIIVKYIDFIRYSMPSALLNVVSLQLPVFFMSFFFSEKVVGYYSLSHRVLGVPLALVGGAIGQVFFQKAAEVRDDKTRLRDITWQLYKTLLYIGVLPMGVVLFFGKELFGLIFGDRWEIAGQYAQWLCLWLLFVFISSPLSTLFFVTESQKKGLFFQIIVFSSRMLVLFMSLWIFREPEDTILNFGISGALIFGGFSVYLMTSVGVPWKKMVITTCAVLVAVFSILYLIKICIYGGISLV